MVREACPGEGRAKAGGRPRTAFFAVCCKVEDGAPPAFACPSPGQASRTMTRERSCIAADDSFIPPRPPLGRGADEGRRIENYRPSGIKMPVQHMEGACLHHTPANGDAVTGADGVTGRMDR
jgi:hypothetical protein